MANPLRHLQRSGCRVNSSLPEIHTKGGNVMVYTLRYKMALVAVLALTGSLVSFSSVSTAAESSESPWIGDGSKVTLLYEITVPGDERFEVRDLSQFVQGQHQMLPALERPPNCRLVRRPAMCWKMPKPGSRPPSPRCRTARRSSTITIRSPESLSSLR